jgi:hypothetical protein
MGNTNRVPEEQSRTRRALLGAGVGAMAATVLAALGRPLRAEANHGDVHLGTDNVATSTTVITNTDVGESALWGNSTATAGVNVGVRGDANSAAGFGVWGRGLATSGTGRSIGVRGESAMDNGVGVHGVLLQDGMGLGVFGEADHADAVGAAGSSSSGTGVSGSTSFGIGVDAFAGTAAAIAQRSGGRVQFARVSGVATIAAGARSVVVTPSFAAVTAQSFVLLTPKVNLAGRSLWFTTDPATDRFTIRMSSSRAKPTAVAWLLIG